MASQIITLRVNDDSFEVAVEPRATLLDALRDELGLTGAKEGCGMGNCGACTVLADGKPIASCLTLAVEAQGRAIVTIEGLAKNGQLHPIQQAFIESSALQCGFCTPGFVLSAKALLDSNPEPTETEVKEAIRGNLCRCTGYTNIVEAIINAGQRMKRTR